MIGNLSQINHDRHTIFRSKAPNWNVRAYVLFNTALSNIRAERKEVESAPDNVAIDIIHCIKEIRGLTGDYRELEYNPIRHACPMRTYTKKKQKCTKLYIRLHKRDG